MFLFLVIKPAKKLFNVKHAIDFTLIIFSSFNNFAMAGKILFTYSFWGLGAVSVNKLPKKTKAIYLTLGLSYTKPLEIYSKYCFKFSE